MEIALTQEPVIKKFKRSTVYACFENNIWSADLAEIGSLSSFNCGVKYILCMIDFFTKYIWVKPLKDKKSKRVFFAHNAAYSDSNYLAKRTISEKILKDRAY